jgi:hypothetical protein
MAAPTRIDAMTPTHTNATRIDAMAPAAGILGAATAPTRIDQEQLFTGHCLHSLKCVPGKSADCREFCRPE